MRLQREHTKVVILQTIMTVAALVLLIYQTLRGR